MLDNKLNTAARLKEARIKLRVGSGEFAQKAGIDPRNYSSIETGKRTVGERILRDICSAFPIDINWLLTGDGEMLKGGESSVQKLATDEYLLVPMYNFDARGGFQSNDIVDTTEYIEKYIPFPSARKLDICVPVSGDSMIPVYPPGSIILLREVSGWREYFGFGGNFMLILKDGRRIIKRVQKSIDDARNNVLCVSYNHLVDDEELPKEMIDKVYKVIRTLTDEGY